MSQQQTLAFNQDQRVNYGVDYPATAWYPWSKQLQVLQADYEIRLMPWANRCGKTTTVCCEACLAGMGQAAIPYPKPPFVIWAVSNSYKQMEDSFIPAFEGDATHPRMLPRGVHLNRQRMEYKLPSGSKIRLKSAEAGRDSFQGAAVPLILLDEDIEPAVLKEIFARIGPGYKRRIMWSLTAVNGLTYSYHYLYKPWLEAHQQGRQHPKIFVIEAAMDENPYLAADEIESLLKFYPPHSKEYQVRRYGGFQNIAGDSVFSEAAIDRHEALCTQAQPTLLSWAGEGDKVNQEPVKSSHDVALSIWREPVRGHNYTVGGDVAEGKLSDINDQDSDRDYSAAAVLDRETREIVATLHCRVDPHRFGMWLWLIGHYYNYAWLCPELNHNGVAVLGVLRGSVELPTARDLPAYNRIYARETDFDEYAEDISDDKLGWKTTTVTRPKMVGDFYTFFESPECHIYDRILVEEARSFQRNKLGKPEHSSGFHDDVLFAAMLALQADLLCPSGAAVAVAGKTGTAITGGGFDPSNLIGMPEDTDWLEDYGDEEEVA